MRHSLLLVSELAVLVSAVFAISKPVYNDGIHLAVTPASNCARKHVDFSAVNVTSNVNAGLWDLHEYKTIVTFGDSYTTAGVTDGSTPAPPVVIPPNPKAGGRTTNGLTWIENIADDVGAHLMDYAVCYLSNPTFSG